MIFVTVGTDHHPFPRVFEWIAKAREDSSIDPSEPIVAQYGHTRVALPADCEGKQFLPFDEMLDNFRKAQFVVTHGSSSALLACYEGTPTLVVPRKKEHGEHIDDHQVEFANDTRDVFPFIVADTYDEFAHAIAAREEALERFASFRSESCQAIARLKSAFDSCVRPRLKAPECR